MSQPPATRIGRYRLLAVIGTGAFATVHRAADERLADTVALKVLAENHSLDPEIRERFLTEGRVLRRINSIHVVRVHDLGETDQQQPYLVLEYADRGTLADRVTGLRARGWCPTPDDVRAVASPLAAAMRTLHRADVVHRDLSPGNVLLRSRPADKAGSGSPVVAGDERLLLADLGLCKDLAINSGLTAAGGTEGFRPPEQRGGPAVIDARADLWALCALLVWLLTDAPPERGRSVRDAVTAAGMPAQLGAVLDRSLADDPAARHPDAAAWLEAVTDALQPPPAVATRTGEDRATAAPVSLPAAPEAASQSDSPQTPRRPVRTVAAAAVGVVVGLLLALGVPMLGGGVQVSDLDDGRVRVADRHGDAQVAIVGPAEVPAGESATFTAEVDGVTAWMWVGPDGALHPRPGASRSAPPRRAPQPSGSSASPPGASPYRSPTVCASPAGEP